MGPEDPNTQKKVKIAKMITIYELIDPMAPEFAAPVSDKISKQMCFLSCGGQPVEIEARIDRSAYHRKSMLTF